MAMLHANLLSYYEKLFAFKHYHGWNVAEIEDLIPWEFEVMSSLLKNYLDTVELRRKQAAANANK